MVRRYLAKLNIVVLPIAGGKEAVHWFTMGELLRQNKKLHVS